MLRAELLGHLGSVETGASYGAQLLRTVLSIAATYGPHRLPRILANLNASIRALLPEYTKVDLLSRWPRSPVPVDLLFGDADLLSPAAVIEKVRPLLGPQDTLRVIHNAGHMAHFDAPAVVRSVVVGGKKPAGAVASAQTATRPRIA
jgi:pimeloyl-ACP methyl ester carboxylesterase